MPAFIWIGFLAFILVMLLLDLGVFHREAHVVKVPEALAWTAVWVALALAFNVLVYFLYSQNELVRPGMASEHLTGQQAAIQFLTGYLMEKSLSIDNIFVIAMIFTYLRVPLAQQHRLLIWGVVGAIVLRGLMITAGAILIEQVEWIVYVFGILLLASAAKMMVLRHDSVDFERNFVVKLVRRFYPVSSEFHGGSFFTRIAGRKAVTPLFLGLILVETSDVVFALDSIPAIFAITRDPFLVWTSNVFAILGLRSLYFALAGLMERFRYVKMSLVFLLAYVGVKMLLSHHYPIPNLVSLAMISGILAVGVAASILAGSRDTAALASPIADHMEELAAVTYRQSRRVVILLLGSTVLVIGAAMLLLPGPALLVIPLGLSILAVEFAWARRWLAKIRETVGEVQRRLWHEGK